MSRIIEIKGLKYINEDGNCILSDLDAVFSSGEKVAIVGESGKTILLKLIMGLLKPKEGSVYLFGEDISSISSSRLNLLRSRIGFVFQDAMLISNLKVIENVMLPVFYHKEYPRDVVFRMASMLLKRVGYDGDVWSLPGVLSIQTRKIVAMARAMAIEPNIIIYDEFLDEFDKTKRQMMIRLVNEFHTEREGRITIMTFDRGSDIEDIIFNRVLRIEEGRLV